MQWHANECMVKGCLKHPTNAYVWKEFDGQYENFSNDPRNVQLDLTSDEFNPFQTMSIT